jgi:hypothetical protein
MDRKIPILKGMHKWALHRVLRQVLAKDQEDNLWGYFNQINNKREELRGTSVTVKNLKKQQAKWVKKQIESIEKLESTSAVESYY